MQPPAVGQSGSVGLRGPYGVVGHAEPGRIVSSGKGGALCCRKGRPFEQIGGASEAHRNGWRALSAMIVAGVGVAAAAILGDAVFVVEEDQTDGERAEREESN